MSENQNGGPGCIHDDIQAIRDAAVVCSHYPAVPAAVSEALQAVARVADDLAHRLEAIEQPKPCEGCGQASTEEPAEAEAPAADQAPAVDQQPGA